MARTRFSALLSVPLTFLSAIGYAQEAGDVASGGGTDTHVQAASIGLLHDGKPAIVKTFCLDLDGNVVAVCGGKKTVQRVTSAGRKAEVTEQPSEVRFYSPRGDLLKTWPVSFEPDSVNISGDGAIYIGGAGRIQKLDADGKVVAEARTPAAQDMQKLEEEVRLSLIEQGKTNRVRYAEMLEKAKSRQAELNALEQPTPQQKVELTRVGAQVKSYENMLKNLEQQTQPNNISAQLAMKLKVPGIAVGSNDVFVACQGLKGFGYEVYRMTRDLQEPQKIVGELRGCCGQMDIQTKDGQLFVAENARHRVTRYDREGKVLSQFGAKESAGNDGFGGCCNPMNLRFGPQGEVITAESEGRVKRYDVDGNLLGVIGVAKLAGGCKHVAVAGTKDLSRVFILDLTKSEIAVLDRKAQSNTGERQSEASEQTTRRVKE